MPRDVAGLAELLASEGFVAAREEAEELVEAAGGEAGRLEKMVRRRLTGEPLAWITGKVVFCGVEVRIDREVYVPRWQSEGLAERAVERVPERGVAVDLCTGSGAVAKVMGGRRPGARVVGVDLDPTAVACAKANGVEAYVGDLFDAVPPELREQVDVVVGVVPYVPTPELGLLQRDTFTFETALSYDGGPDGLAIARRAVDGAARWLRPGGALLLELGGDEPGALEPHLRAAGFTDVTILQDEDGDVRGIEATLSPPGGRRPSARGGGSAPACG